ncbi:MAG: YbjN domain-containing protein [Bacteroidota bacterium]|jgi:hypothetical protein
MASIVNATRNKVKSFLKEIYGRNYKNSVQEVDDSFVIRQGSAVVNIFVRPMSKEDCLVTSQAYVVQGAKIGPKILGMLMRLNATNPVGAFGLLFDDTIIFRHSISGANLDLNEMRTSIRTVAFFSDEYDDAICKIAGGTRAIDAQSLLGGSPAAAKASSGKALKKAPVSKKAAPAKQALVPKKTPPVKKTPVSKKAPVGKKAPARKK